MRTNIEIDDELIAQAMHCAGVNTKKAAVEAGLKLLLRTRAQVSVRGLRGKVAWEGNLDRLRSGRNQD